ncbi:MAG: ribosome maturation factor RimM, partial [Desulfobulbales bacterium]|nr:ribosome maturation factor RimM [Desulfobulbales bacterium]
DSEQLSPESADDLVMVGEIVKPHGIRGEVKVYPYSERPENFQLYKEVVLVDEAAGRTTIYKVVKSREQGKLAILQLENVVSREDAEALLGSRIWLKKTQFPKLGSGEYYWHQLKGLTVITESGRKIGPVSKIFSTRAHDILVVSSGGNEYLIPIDGAIIREIDEQEGKIIISPPEGLLEINT